MEIKPGHGIDQLVFGITESDAEQQLGKPDRIFELLEETDEIIYQYNEQKLRLTFFKHEGGKLGYIRCAHPELTYQGKKIMGRPIEVVKSSVFYDIEEWDVEHEDFFTSYVNEEYWLTLNVEYNVVTDIELGVQVNEEEEYEWRK